MEATRMELDPREQRGLVIATTMKVRELTHGGWRVPSQSFVGTYAVWSSAKGMACSCPDFEERQLPCKHVHAVMFTLLHERRRTAEGEVTTTTTVKVTYGQDWPAYNTAQTVEKEMFLRLLSGLCAGIEEPPQEKGRPRLPLRDMVFAGAFKVYSTASARRFMTDLRVACDAGYITKAPHYNSIFNYFEKPELTPIIRGLITASSLPLKAVETDFAADSTGFGTCRTFHYYDMRYGNGEGGAGTERAKRDWLKLHAMIGCRTNVVTSVEVTDKRRADTTQFVPLLEQTAENFTVFRVMADGAYSSSKNLEAAERIGAKPFIPFASHTTGKGGSETFRRLFHLFSLQRENFLAVYHKRSNVESTFSTMKRKFGDRLRSKTPIAQVNELLLKVLAHNLCCVIHAMHELRITPAFSAGQGGVASST
jgi:transposase